MSEGSSGREISLYGRSLLLGRGLCQTVNYIGYIYDWAIVIVSRSIDDSGMIGLPGFSIPGEIVVAISKAHIQGSFAKETDVTVARVWSW